MEALEERVEIPSDDVILVGGYTPSDAATAGVVICPPHPFYGGTMENNVVFAVRDALVSIGFSTLRFNFRGVGGSGGRSTGELLDGRDVGAAIDFLEGKSGKGAPLFLVGYSYGAWVGLFHAISDERVDGWIAISPPTTMFDFSYLSFASGPKLFIAGDADFLCEAYAIREMASRLTDPKKVVVIPGADHFFWGHENYLIKEVQDFMENFCDPK